MLKHVNNTNFRKYYADKEIKSVVYYIKKEPAAMKKFKRIISEQIFILLGALLLSLGVNLFLAPNKVSSGGVTSIGTVLLYLYSVKLSVTNLAVNAVLFVLGWRHLGRSAVFKTALGIVYLSVFLELTSLMPTYTNNILIASITGGALMGLGIGLVVRVGASTGGSDFSSLILKRFFPHLSISTLILITDSLIIIMSGIVFKSFEITFYSMLSLYVSYKLTDIILTFGNSAKSIRIFSRKSDEIAQTIINRFERGVSGLHCCGMYSKSEGYMLLCVVSPKEVPLIIREVKKIDKNSFIFVEEATDVWGEGFQQVMQ